MQIRPTVPFELPDKYNALDIEERLASAHIVEIWVELTECV